MSIVTISRGSYSRGKKVAEKVAQKLGYECISREILLEASEQFNIPEIKLVRAIHDAPSVLDYFTYGKERYIAYIRAALLKHLQKDNVVYHGLAGHFFLQTIPHVVKVRITADLEDRVKEEIKRENISAEEARRILEKDDHERRKWSHHLYGIDTQDSNLYDMVLHLSTMTVDDAVTLILHNVQLPCFQTTPESQRVLDGLAVVAQVQAALFKEFPTARVYANNGQVLVNIDAPLSKGKTLTREINHIAEDVAGGKDLKVHVWPVIPYD